MKFQNYTNFFLSEMEKIKGPFISLKMTYRKMFSAFLDVCFAENKWSTENIFLINWKSSYFSVKCLTDLKNVKHFTSFFSFFFFPVKYFLVSHFSKNIVSKVIFCETNGAEILTLSYVETPRLTLLHLTAYCFFIDIDVF